MRKKILILLIVNLLAISNRVSAQSQFSLMPGIFYNGSLLKDEVNGIGGVLGLEYMSRKNHFFSLELRTKYMYYSFNDGTKWTEGDDGLPIPPKNQGEARLEYALFSPQVGLVPKFYLSISNSFSLFLENELAVGLMSGNLKFKGVQRKERVMETILCYNVGAGFEYKEGKYSWVASLGYSTLNFREKIRKHKPTSFDGGIPNQNAVLWLTVIFKVPLSGSAGK